MEYHDGMSTYQYVGSEPTGRIDPEGLWGKPISGTTGPCQLSVQTKRMIIVDADWKKVYQGRRVPFIKDSIGIFIEGKWLDNCCCKEASITVTLESRAKSSKEWLKVEAKEAGKGIGLTSTISSTIQVGAVNNMLDTVAWIVTLEDDYLWKEMKNNQSIFFRISVSWSCTAVGPTAGKGGAAPVGVKHDAIWKFPVGEGGWEP